MRKLVGGAVACAVAATSSLIAVGAGAVQAQEDPDLSFEVLEAALAPADAAPGDEITVTPVENCSATTGFLSWAVFEAGDFSWEGPADEEGEIVDIGDVELNGDGSWQVTFTAPGGPEGGGDFAAQAEEDPEDPAATEVYGPLALDVDGTAYEWFGICYDYVQPEILVADITSHDDHPVLGFPLVDQVDELTVAPIDACPVTGEGDELYYQLETWPLDPEEPYELVDSGYLPVDGAGGWDMSFAAPDDGNPAEVTFYVLWLYCENRTDLTGMYDLLLFAVGDDPVPAPPAEPPADPGSPRPARPVTADPGYTG